MSLIKSCEVTVDGLGANPFQARSSILGRRAITLQGREQFERTITAAKGYICLRNHASKLCRTTALTHACQSGDSAHVVCALSSAVLEQSLDHLNALPLLQELLVCKRSFLLNPLDNAGKLFVYRREIVGRDRVAGRIFASAGR